MNSLSNDMNDHDLTIALEAVEKAGAYLREAYERFEVIPDAPATISTEADRQSQEIILGRLSRAFPGDAFAAEEATAFMKDARRSGERLWIVDPIDGTRGFARKNGEFSVMVGLVEKGEIRVGVVHQPAVGRWTYATRGGGCWRRDVGMAKAEACRVTCVSTLAEATLTQSRSREPGRRSRWAEALQPARIVESYSAGIKLALVARGEADIYLNTYEAFSDWDICAGHILVTEAGGKVTGAKGQTIVYGGLGARQEHGLLATNGKLHEAALKRIGAA
ncbi:MAG: 3'(2'),5'-bisphosphate nucleotidase CysQ [Gemmataceae bacterium]